MTDRDDDAPRGNGRRIALAIVLLAFVASATTAILAFTASRRANERDAAGMAADAADLHGMLSRWTVQRDAVVALPVAGREPALDALDGRAAPLAAWKPRTPCGAQARDRLDARLRDLGAKLRKGDAAKVDVSAELDRTMRDCEATRGRDVDI